MKAHNKKTRWLLVALLLGFLAVAGLTFVRHHGAAVIAQASHTAPAAGPSQQPGNALLASSGGRQPLWVPPAPGADDTPVSGAYSNIQQPPASHHSGAPANASTGTASGNSPASPADNMPPQHDHPAVSNTTQPPQNPANVFAYNGYAPLDCELPAGCGAVGNASYVSRQPPVTSGGGTVVHDPQDSNPSDGSSPPTGDDGNPTPGNNSQDPPGQSDPPVTHPVASAPELDPATLAGAITLLLGSLAVLRSRRVRATG